MDVTPDKTPFQKVLTLVAFLENQNVNLIIELTLSVIYPILKEINKGNATIPPSIKHDIYGFFLHLRLGEDVKITQHV